METNLKDELLQPIVICHEQKLGAGEDCYATVLTDSGTYMQAVFDGCGGLGAKRYPSFEGHTGAWIASRAVAFMTESFFESDGFQFDVNSMVRYKRLNSEVLKKLEDAYGVTNGVKLMGSLSKALPTTVALTAIRKSSGQYECYFIWAGDSRCYVLDKAGLHQHTFDHISSNGDDAFKNIREDGILTRTFNANDDLMMNYKVFQMARKEKFLLINATDGCFGYLRSPMEFEYILLKTLLTKGVQTPEQWKKTLEEEIDTYAGDDYTFTITAVNFESFNDLQKYYVNRFHELQDLYFSKENQTEEEMYKAWLVYKRKYNQIGHIMSEV